MKGASFSVEPLFVNSFPPAISEHRKALDARAPTTAQAPS